MFVRKCRRISDFTVALQLGECVSWAGAVECVCSCGAPGLSSLQQRLAGALHLAQLRHSSVDQAQVARVQPLALKLQDMLRDKLAELAARRDHLKVCLLFSSNSFRFSTLHIGLDFHHSSPHVSIEN